MKIIYAVVCLCVLGGVFLWKDSPKQKQDRGSALSDIKTGKTIGKALIGGPFQLIDHTGRMRDYRDFRGRWTLVYFGYTYCPDICPMALDNLSDLLKKLGDDAKKINVIFITVDPARDTQKVLHEFMEHYDSRIVGLTGSPQDIEKAMTAYRVHAAKFDEKDPVHYSMDHSSLIYVMSPQGQYVEAFNHLTPADHMAVALKKNL